MPDTRTQDQLRRSVDKISKDQRTPFADPLVEQLTDPTLGDDPGTLDDDE